MADARRLNTLLVDLDGTLVDPCVGIISSFRHALEAMGAEAPEPAKLHWVIGPPSRVSFRELLGNEAAAEQATAIYRARYSETGIFDATVYPGIEAALAGLRAAGVRLIVCTSKARVFALRVLAHFKLDLHLGAVYGAELDGRFDDKGDLIAHLLKSEGLRAEGACMIGDRKYDVLGAHRNQVAAIGVLWGYGGEAELREAGADALCAAPGQIAATLGALHFNERVRRSHPAGA